MVIATNFQQTFKANWQQKVLSERKLPANKGNFQRPFELATSRLINMIEVLKNWDTYFPYPSHITQRGGTFLFDSELNLLRLFYEYIGPRQHAEVCVLHHH